MYRAFLLQPLRLMAEPGAGCNPRSGAERILDDFDPALSVDQSHIEPHLAVQSGGFGGHEFQCCSTYSLCLTVGHPLGSDGMGLGALDLDEHQLRAITQNKINFPCRTAPAPGCDGQSFAQIGSLDLILGHPATVMGNGPFQAFLPSFSAVW
jgi:hypothetical protein